MTKKLTAAAVEALKPKDKPYYVADSEEGLRLRIATSGVKSWNVAYRIKGGSVKSTAIGRADNGDVTLAEARDRARAILKAARQGVDLVASEAEEKQAAKEALTLGNVIDLYAKAISSPRRRGGPLRTASEIESRLKRTFATKLDRLPDDLTRAQLSRLLDAVADEFPREAEKRRQTASAFFKWAASKGFADNNPVAGMPTYSTGETRDRALTPSEIKIFLDWLDAGADDMPIDCIAVLKLQLLLGARVGEIAGMEASEFSQDEADRLVWTLPASRSKNKKERRAPIVGEARTLIEAALERRPRGPLFRTIDGTRSLQSTDLGHALGKRTLPVQKFVTHDLRRTVATGLDELGISLDTIAAVLGHQRGNAEVRTLVRHYSRPRLDDRIEAALTAWDAHIREITSGDHEKSNVVHIRSK